MSHLSLDVYVIETPFSRRSAPLIKMLLTDERINLIKIPATMVKSDRDISDFGIKVNYKIFPLIEGRPLSHGEIGCAQSHNVARSLLAESENGGVILEDDARILNLELFINISKDFLDQHKNDKRILSLSGRTQICKVNKKNTKIQAQKWIRIYGKSPLAVANVITPTAASELYNSNQPIKYVADWPYSRSKFYSVKNPIVSHGDENTVSLINTSGSRERNKKVNIWFLTYSFLRFITTRNKQFGIRQYFNWVIVQRFSYRFNKFLSSIKSI